LEFLNILKDAQKEYKSGVVYGKSSILSHGKGNDIETTSIAILCWLNEYEKFTFEVETAMIWLQRQKQYGYYGNTNSNLFAIKALVRYDKLVGNKNKNLKKLDITLTVNNKNEIKIPIKLSDDDYDIIETEDFSKYLLPGDQVLKLSISDGSIPFCFNSTFCSLKENTSEKCVLKLETKLSNDKFTEGDTGEINITLKNTSDLKQGMNVCIIGLPSGLEPRIEQIQELLKSETINSYEIKGRDLILYKNMIDKNEELKFKVDVTARFPGTYKGNCSRSYLYYTNEDKFWVDGLKCDIKPLKSE